MYPKTHIAAIKSMIFSLLISFAFVNSAWAGEIHDAVEEGDLNKVMELINVDSSLINIRDGSGSTPLHIATMKAHKIIVDFLISKGANIEAEGSYGRTPLHMAVINGSKDIVELMLSKGAQIETKDNKGKTPLHTAMLRDTKDIAELLLSKGAQIETKDNKGKTPLHTAMLRDTKDIAELMLSKGAQIEAKDSEGKTPLHTATFRGNKDIAELLLSKGANIEARDNHGQTPLHKVARDGRKDIVEFLISRGAEIEAKNNLGETPLHEAAQAWIFTEDVLEFLISRGAEIETKNKNGETPLHTAARYGNIKIVEFLFSKGAEIETKNKNGETPLHAAVVQSDLPYIPPFYRNLDVIEFLHSEGADIEAKDKNGKTPLHRALQRGFNPKNVVELLLSKGANVNVQDDSGNTPLHIAFKWELASIAETLLNAEKIDPCIKNADGLRACDFAEKSKLKNSLQKMCPSWWDENPIKKWGLIYLGSMLLLWTILLIASPLSLLWLSAKTSNVEIKIKKIPFVDVDPPFPIGLRLLLLLQFFHYRPRVLNAWVRKNARAAREYLEGLESVQHRSIHILTVPFQLRDKPYTELQPSLLREQVFTKDRGRWRLAIHGEGGAGKTSMAIHLAKWAMSDMKDDWIAHHPMIPILMEDELAEEETFKDQVHGRLHEIIGTSETISDELVDKLLRKKRVLVIIDHFSEMSEITRKKVNVTQKEFPINALVITSRIKENIKGAAITYLSPQRIDGKRLTVFIDAYLAAKGERGKFEDSEYLRGCLGVSEMVGERAMTPMLAKLFAEMMIATKKGSQFKDLPGTIPDLMLSYLNFLNRNREEGDPDDLTVQKIAKAIAWAELEPTFRPGKGYLSSVRDILSDVNNLEDKLEYLRKNLGIIEIHGPEHDKIRITLDPLAEYLAGLRLLELNGDSEEKWNEFLKKTDIIEGAPESIKGFLLAVRDCCNTKGNDFNVPDFVQDELAKRAGLSLEAIEKVQLQQRIKRLIENLKLPDAEDRKAAIIALSKIGSKAKNSAPHIISLLEDEDEDVRKIAAETMCIFGSEAIPLLIKSLKSKNMSARVLATWALGKIGKEAQGAVPVLIETLHDDNAFIRRLSAWALGKIGLETQKTVPALIKILKDNEIFVRTAVAQALGNIGMEANEAIPALIESLNDENYPVRRIAAWALGNIGPEACSAEKSLKSLLLDSEEEVRKAAQIALARINS